MPLMIFFLKKDYVHARLLFDVLSKQHPEDLFLGFMSGLCKVQDSCYFHPDMTKHIPFIFADTFVQHEIENILFVDHYVEPHNLDTTKILADDISFVGYSDDEFIAKFGSVSVDSLAFRVQLGAYKNVDNFDHTRIAGLPMVLRNTQHDGITRFTIGEYKTLKEAGKLCKKARHNGIRDAFIFAIYKGQTIYFTELIRSNVLRG